MRRLFLSALAALGVAACLAPERAEAQAPFVPNAPYRPPTVSPYINLLRRGSIPAVNYQGLVRPQLQFNQQLQGLQQQVNTAQAYISEPDSPMGVRPTGYRSQFQNHQRYFLNHFGGSASPAGRPGFATTGAAPAARGLGTAPRGR